MDSNNESWAIEYSRMPSGKPFISIACVQQLLDLYEDEVDVTPLKREFAVLEMELATGLLSDGRSLPDEGGRRGTEPRT